MTWQFTLIENFYDDRETVIDEPVGWDALSMVLQRDNDWHGISPQFSASNLQFAGIAYFILKDEYERIGIDGKIGIRIQWKCDDCTIYNLYFEGKLDFGRYDENCDEGCYISLGIEDNSPQTLLKNRMDTDVDLTSNIDYYGSAELTDYAGLNKKIEIPSKALLIKTQGQNDTPLTSENLSEDFQWFTNTGGSPQMRAQILPAFTKILYVDIPDSVLYSDILMINGGFQGMPAPGLVPLIDFKALSANLNCTTSDIDINYRYKGNVAHAGGSFATAPKLQFIKLPFGLDETDPFSYQLLANDTLVYGISGFDITQSLSTTFEQGDRFWLVHFIFVNDPDGFTDFTVTEDAECFINIQLKSVCESTPCKTFLIHEAASRIIENITNNTLQFKSAYYGRTDSEPFAFAEDGCGGLRAITNGLLIRRAVLTDETAPKVFTNFSKMLKSLNSIDCIGYGIEASAVRAEPVKYFYKDAIVFVADGVKSYTKRIRTDRVWNQFSFGYQKYETESTNGLDAQHTKRQYRIPLENTDGTLEKTSEYIGDGYAEEVTRRKFGSTEDWRYDQDIFLLCLKRGEDDLEVEQGNIDSPANMFDPPTVINYRITPVRNAIRWFAWVMQGIRHIDAVLSRMLFNSGDGNYVAEGKLQDDDCVMEDAVIAENDPLYVNQFANTDDSTPFIVPEEVVFSFPLGLNEFLFLKQNIYGLVQYRRDVTDDWKFGWITKLEPRHEDGDATFTLVTALGGSPVDTNEFIITEGGLVITDESGQGLITEN